MTAYIMSFFLSFVSDFIRIKIYNCTLFLTLNVGYNISIWHLKLPVWRHPEHCGGLEMQINYLDLTFFVIYLDRGT